MTKLHHLSILNFLPSTFVGNNFIASSLPIEILDAIIFIIYISSILGTLNGATFNSLNWIHVKFNC